jgi:hypothetical protein
MNSILESRKTLAKIEKLAKLYLISGKIELFEFPTEMTSTEREDQKPFALSKDERQVIIKELIFWYPEGLLNKLSDRCLSYNYLQDTL